MGQSTTRLSSGPDSSRRELVLASILTIIAGAGWCIAFALGFWVRGLVDVDAGRSARAAPESEAVSPPATSRLDPPPVLSAERTEPERVAGAQVKAAVVAEAQVKAAVVAEAQVKAAVVAPPSTTPPAVAATGPLATAAKPPADRPAAELVRDQNPKPAHAAPERFVLHQPAPRTSFPFVLPEKPSFALAALKLDEPTGWGQPEQVCAVDRSLDTALTWARSPGEAAEEARKEGKLIFLIHVSGNFEDPGFT